MRISWSPRLLSYGALATLALVAALASGHAELAVLATPFALFVAIGLARATPPAVRGELRLEPERVLEGAQTCAILAIENRGSAARIEAGLSLPARVHGSGAPSVVWLSAGERRELAFELDVARWGLHEVGPAVVRARDRLGLLTVDGPLGRPCELRAYPTVARLQALVAPLRTRPILGSQVSRDRGEGIEFADLRPLEPGDRVRSINWRATSRSGVPWVNVQHPEHSTDVVLFLDTFAEAERAQQGTLDAAVHAAAALASAYLARRDRVALVSFGGTLRWLTPASGTRQLYGIVETLLASDARRSYTWRDVTHLPPRLLPPRALVLALSPLLDERGVGALLDLRARGCDLAVLEVSPIAHTPASGSDAHRLALRLWRLQRDALRARFEVLGVPVVPWEHLGTGLELAIEEVSTFRRHARTAARA